MKKRKPIAIAVYYAEGGNLYQHPIYTAAMITRIRSGTHPYVEDHKCIIVYLDMTTEDHT